MKPGCIAARVSPKLVGECTNYVNTHPPYKNQTTTDFDYGRGLEETTRFYSQRFCTLQGSLL
ncbi:hypothetical protein M514_27102 [Trichuris suis]|uniref:Uncharacterized protein n=1 Tax=Trichuris suis TaxID=68888 RepID=A0A085MU12_9BILA|nr:hypothetical protein M514_27102 [Trichuris suis]